MDLPKILNEMRAERELLDRVIHSLEVLHAGNGPRRGRPPKWLQEAKARGPFNGRKKRPQRAAKAA